MTEPVVEALSFIKTLKPWELKQAWVDEFCSALNLLKKSDKPQIMRRLSSLYKKASHKNSIRVVLIRLILLDW